MQTDRAAAIRFLRSLTAIEPIPNHWHPSGCRLHTQLVHATSLRIEFQQQLLASHGQHAASGLSSLSICCRRRHAFHSWLPRHFHKPILPGELLPFVKFE